MKRTVAVLVFLSVLLACTQQKSLYRKTEFLMDTIVSITFSSRADLPAVDAAFSRLRQLEKKLNVFDPESEVSAINRQAGIKPVAPSKDTYALIKRALEVSEATRGAFDITVGAVSLLYDFPNKKIPSLDQIKQRLALVGFRLMKLRKGEVFLPKKGMRIDPGGIAKGYGADQAAKVLKARGIKHALVAIAGDIKAVGTRADGKPWKVGIKDPRGGPDDVYAVVSLPADWAISTSGDYERYVIKDGKRYHHIIDPHTGLPAEAGLVSVSCMGPEATLTDSLATAVFIMGKSRGVKLAESLGYGVILVDTEGEVYVSPTAKAYTKVLYKPKVNGL